MGIESAGEHQQINYYYRHSTSGLYAHLQEEYGDKCEEMLRNNGLLGEACKTALAGYLLKFSTAERVTEFNKLFDEMREATGWKPKEQE